MGLLDKVASKLLQFTDYGRLTGRADKLNKKSAEFFKHKAQVQNTQEKTLENLQNKINDLDVRIKEQRELLEKLEEMKNQPTENKEIKYLPKDEE